MFSQLGCAPFFLPVSLPGTYFFPCLLSLVCPFSFSHAFFASQSILFPLHALSGMPFFLFCMSFWLLGAYFFSCSLSLVCPFLASFNFRGILFLLLTLLGMPLSGFLFIFLAKFASRGILFPLLALSGMPLAKLFTLIDILWHTKGILLSSILHGRFQFQTNV